MWPNTFEEQLADWHQLRTNLATADIATQVAVTNDWWFRVPIVARHLKWDEVKNWPGPWDLLADNTYCELARGLGMLYTMLMINNLTDIHASLVQTKTDNLVLIEHGKYIMNWAPRVVLNIESTQLTIQRQLDSSILHQHLG
jgi:hypothetical protein